MLSNNPATRWVRKDWVLEVYEDYKPHEPHICIYKPTKTGLTPEPASWEVVKKIFLQFKAEGFMDKYKGQKTWIGYPEKNKLGEVKMHFVTVSFDEDHGEALGNTENS